MVVRDFVNGSDSSIVIVAADFVISTVVSASAVTVAVVVVDCGTNAEDWNSAASKDDNGMSLQVYHA